MEDSLWFVGVIQGSVRSFKIVVDGSSFTIQATLSSIFLLLEEVGPKEALGLMPEELISKAM